MTKRDKKQELFDITLSKDGSRMVAKLNAPRIDVHTYNGSIITMNKGDWFQVDNQFSIRKNIEFLLENEYISQEVYDKKIAYMDMLGDNFRARVTANLK